MNKGLVIVAFILKLICCPFNRFGRKPVFAVSLVLMVVCSVSISFAPNIAVFCVLRFCEAFFNMGVITSAFVFGKQEFF